MSRTVLAHVNVQIPAGYDGMTADDVETILKGALEVGLEGAPQGQELDVEIVLCEEI